MKILLDENLPKKLKTDFTDHEIFTVHDEGWQSKKNGELIELMVKNNFDILITFDQNLQHQQNFKKYPIKVITLSAISNTYENLKSLLPSIKNELSKSLKPEVVNIKL